MATCYDMCKAPIEITRNYILYRNRLIDSSSIRSFHTKGKRLMINSYKQNTSYPTMLVMFPSKEDAQKAFVVLKDTMYTPPPPVPTDVENSAGVAGAVLGVMLCALLAYMTWFI